MGRARPGADRRRHGGDRRRRRDGRRPPRRLGRAQARRDRLRPHVRDVAPRAPSASRPSRRQRATPPGSPSRASSRSSRRLTLRIGQTAKLKVVLRAKAIAESVTVDRRGAPRRRLQDRLVDEHRPRADPGRSRSPNREFEKLAFIAPGVQRERGEFRFVTGGPVIGSGGNASQSTILVDGVDYTDPALGLAKTRVSPGRHRRVPRRQHPLRRRGRRLRRRRPDGPHEDRDERASRARVFALLPRRRRCAPRAPSSRTRASTSAAASTASRSAGRSSRTRPTSSSRPSTSTRSSPRSSGPRAPSCRQAADVEVPFNQILAFGSVTHSLTDSQSLLVKADYERYREENFRVGGVQDVVLRPGAPARQLQLHRAATPGSSGATTTNELRAQYRQPEVLRADELRRRRRLVLDRQHAQDRRQHPRRPPRRGRPVRDPRHALPPPRRQERHARRQGRRRLAARQGPLDHRHVRRTGSSSGATDTQGASRSPTPTASARATSRSTTDRIAALRPGRLAPDVEPDGQPRPPLRPRHERQQPGLHAPARPRAARRRTRTTSSRASASPGTSRTTAQFVARGGWGLFTGRYLLVPSFTELQQNGVTGRKLYTRVNGAPLRPARPSRSTRTTRRRRASRSRRHHPPRHRRSTPPRRTSPALGLTDAARADRPLPRRRGRLRRRATKEIIVRDVELERQRDPRPRPNKSYNQINIYTNDGHSEYKAAHVRASTARSRAATSSPRSVTFADKKNLNDDFSPEFPTGYPSDPAEHRGRVRPRPLARGAAASSSPASSGSRGQFTLAPIFEYGTGQPWTQPLGYDYNGDGKNADRLPGVDRFGEDGPVFRSFDLRLTKAFALGRPASLERDRRGVQPLQHRRTTTSPRSTAREYLSGPTLANPSAAVRQEPELRQVLARRCRPREIQLGAGFAF